MVDPNSMQIGDLPVFMAGCIVFCSPGVAREVAGDAASDLAHCPSLNISALD